MGVVIALGFGVDMKYWAFFLYLPLVFSIPTQTISRPHLVIEDHPASFTGVPPPPAHPSYSGPLNLNTQLVTHPNGAIVPLDEPAVAAARADHLLAKDEALRRAVFAGYTPNIYLQSLPAVAVPTTVPVYVK